MEKWILILFGSSLIATVVSYLPTDKNLSYEEKIHSLRTQLEFAREERHSLQSFITAKLGVIEGRLAMMRSGRFYSHAEKGSPGHGSMYVRWGRTECAGNATQLIYKGYMAGSYNNKGSGSNILCLPEDPTWSQYDDNSNGARGYIYGIEFDTDASATKLLGHYADEDEFPCAVCLTPFSVTHMFPARASCYPGWTEQYTGYLVSDYHDHTSSRGYECLDGAPEAVNPRKIDNDQSAVYLVEVKSGLLPCPPYHDGREVACSVCSK